MGLLVLVLPAYAVNFAFLVISGRLLGITAFGIFYSALSIINILIAPAVITNLFFARKITLSTVKGGYDAALPHFAAYVRYILVWGGLAGAGLFFVLLITGSALGVESLALIILIPAVTVSIYLAESIRALFQGLKKILSLGFYTLFWTILRFLLGLFGIFVVALPWAGLFGIFAAGLTVFCLIFFLVIKKTGMRLFRNGDVEKHANYTGIVSFSASYTVFVLTMYLDNIIAYLFMGRTDLGLYSAACILSKSIILLTNPIVQVFFPVIVEQNVKKAVQPDTVIKSFLITLLLSGAAVAVVCFSPKMVCQYLLGLPECNIPLLRGVAASAVPICILRIIVLIQLGKGYNYHTFLLLPVILLISVFLFLLSDTIVWYAWGYCLMCWIAVFYSVLKTWPFGPGQR